MSSGTEVRCGECGGWYYVPIEQDMADCPWCAIEEAEAARELALINFMDYVNKFCASMNVRMCHDCNLRPRVQTLKEELTAMSHAHIAVMELRREANQSG
jgi:hypothetical protein